MKKLYLLASILLLFFAIHPVQAKSVVPYEEQWQSTDDTGRYEANRYRSGRGSYTGGRTGGIAPGTGTAPRTPGDYARNNPRTAVPPGGGAAAPRPGTGLGGWFGGLAAGAILGSILNPFGFFGWGYGFGTPYGIFSILGLLFWGAILVFAYRWFKRAMRNS
ncbi:MULTISPECIES: hypothetical protein [Paenibacillus]|uniref:hypothetical protein n=1 Tax=Paenibacillus TaxID=44249 RepID=UPI0008886389|nr:MULTISPECIES: hypothetical protein [Paenibacillus]NTZ18866.1 hypothetical protein [Paenibacillus sp. JMULE4]GCL70955.1 hypothetical protein PN4B1_08590 [Paenibacillus naphthalenovorans]SDI58685.1 hypothetical protein SAMN05421868_10828 [Paenibacillus naphthalenovorans]